MASRNHAWSKPVNPSAEDYQQAAVRITDFTYQRITLFDAVIAVMAERSGLEVWTYDHHFDAMRAAVWR